MGSKEVSATFLIEYINKRKNVVIGTTLKLKERTYLFGDLPDTQGVAINAIGSYTEDRKGFNVLSWSYERLAQDDVFVSYARTFPGIGKIKALKILAEYGADYGVFSDLGIMQRYSASHAAEIVEIANKQQTADGKGAFIKRLAGFGVIKKAKIHKIASAFDECEFFSNPFAAIYTAGINLPFRVCNSIVLQMQSDKPELLHLDDRMFYGVEYTLQQLLSRGHTYVNAQVLLEKSIATLNDGVADDAHLVDAACIKGYMNLLNKKHKIKAEKGKDELRIYDAFYYDCEKFIAEELHRKLVSNFKKISLEKIQAELDLFDSNSAFKLADSQRLAVETVVNNPVAIITGSAGTGKTTVLNATIQTLEHLGRSKIVLAAPTGRAARRMSEATSREASTLHSLLHLGIEDEDTEAVDVYMDDEKIDADAVFIDETSMCDISIIYRLLQKLKPSCRLYFIGDPNQLESVGSGNVLSDMIESYCVPVVKLKFIYRQAKDSNIIMNADRILHGRQNLSTGEDFFIVQETETEKIAKLVAGIYQMEVRKVGNLLEVQCICPMRIKGELATNQLNKIVQEKLNPGSSAGCFRANGFVLKRGDKVICSKNTKTVRNGDIGIVTESRNNTLVCDFETGEEHFTVDDAIDLGIGLAYCITVHKSQGSEFQTVIMPVSQENQSMLRRNLFYTAVTRARKKMYLVGDPEQISKTIANNRTSKRNGLLMQRIRKEFCA